MAIEVPGTISILRQQRDWVGGVRKMATFSTIYVEIGWVGHQVSKIVPRNIGMVSVPMYGIMCNINV